MFLERGRGRFFKPRDEAAALAKIAEKHSFLKAGLEFFSVFKPEDFLKRNLEDVAQHIARFLIKATRYDSTIGMDTYVLRESMTEACLRDEGARE